MKLLKRIFTALLILLTFNLYMPGITFAAQSLTKHPLEIRSTPEKTIPVKKVAKKKSKWLWWVLGLVVTGGGAYYLLQGEEEEEKEDTGSYTGTW